MSPRINLDLETILKTAANIANNHGIEAVTLAALAKELNIKSPSLYNHLNGMNGLRLNLAVYGLEEMYKVLVESVIGRSGEDALHCLSEAYVSFVRSSPGLYNAVIFVPDQKDNELQTAGDKIVNLILKLLSPYNLSKEDQIHIVRGLRSLLHGFATLEQSGGFGIPVDRDDSLRMMIDIFIEGINSIRDNNDIN